jgi:phospholipase/carboxylesterase
VTNDSPIEIETGNDVSACIIWLHGLGADGSDFVPIVPELDLPLDLAVRFVFPHAPFRPVTINGGMVMRAWYDMQPAPDGFTETVEHIKESATYLHSLVAEQCRRGIDAARVVLAGFSQGGAVALYAGLHSPRNLAGIMALSSYLPRDPEPDSETTATGRPPAVFMGHGRFDPLIPVARALASCVLLKERGVDVVWHDYPMEHSVCAEELRDISRWLRQVLT